MVIYRFLLLIAVLAQVGFTANAQIVSSGQAIPIAGADTGSEAFTLGPGDRLRITTYGDPELSGEFVVGSDGLISFPLIGNIRAGGVTVSALQGELTTTLSRGYIRNPRVSAEVLTYRPYYILGEVNKPGRFPYDSALTVYNAVATAEGFTYRAKKSVVYIKHAASSKEEKVKLDANTRVQPGDTIRIAERSF